MKRIDKIRQMPVREMAEMICDSNITDEFCRSDCKWVNRIDDDGADESECVKCCVRWLNEEM